MTLLDKAYELYSKEYESREIIEYEFCPYFLDVGTEDVDIKTEVCDKNGNIVGCRGISCKKCWSQDYI